MGAAAICIVTIHFIWHRCVSYRGHNIPTKFVNNRSSVMLNKQKYFFESQDGGDYHVEFGLLGLFDSMYVFCIKVAISLLNLALFSQIVKKWQTFSEIEEGGVRSFWILATMHFQCNICVLNPSPIMFLISLVKIGQIVKKWQPFFGCHLEKYTSGWTIITRKPFFWRRPPSWIFPNMHFQHYRYFPNQNLNVSTNVVDDRSNTKEMAAVFQNPRWWLPPSWKAHFRLNHHHVMSAWLAQLVRAFVAPTHVRSCVQEVRVRSPERTSLTLASIPSG